MLKEQLRLDYSERRSNISFESLSNLSLSIANQILKLPIWSFNYYHIFLPISEKKEIDTSFILSILQGKDKNIALPKMGKDNSLVHYLLTDNTTIKKNKLNYTILYVLYVFYFFYLFFYLQLISLFFVLTMYYLAYL